MNVDTVGFVVGDEVFVPEFNVEAFITETYDHPERPGFFLEQSAAQASRAEMEVHGWFEASELQIIVERK